MYSLFFCFLFFVSGQKKKQFKVWFIFACEMIFFFFFPLWGLSTCNNAYRHLLNFTRPDLQPHVLLGLLDGWRCALIRVLSMGPILGDQTWCKSMVFLKDFSYDSALFTRNDPCWCMVQIFKAPYHSGWPNLCLQRVALLWDDETWSFCNRPKDIRKDLQKDADARDGKWHWSNF